MPVRRDPEVHHRHRSARRDDEGADDELTRRIVGKHPKAAAKGDVEKGFAESYRVLNLEKQGDTNIGWDIVDHSFFPDATALKLLEEDIASPWTGPTAAVLHGSFGAGVMRTFGVKTQLDGSFTAHLVSPTKSRMRLDLYNGPKLVTRGATVRYRVCGQRSLTLKVERLSGGGAFSVQLTKP